MNTQSIVTDLLSNNDLLRSKALKVIYSECFRSVRSYVRKNRGTIEEAEDIFQETISVVYHNVLMEKFRGDSSIFYYTIAIAKKQWLMRLRKRNAETVSLEEVSEPENEDKSVDIDAQLINFLLNKLNIGCQKVLQSFYYEKKNMMEIAESMGLGSTQAAKTKKLRCMKRLSSLIDEYDLQSQDFIK